MKHNGNITMDDIVEIARIMRPRSCAKNLAGTCKEMLGTAVSVGCTVDHMSPNEVISKVSRMYSTGAAFHVRCLQNSSMYRADGGGAYATALMRGGATGFRPQAGMYCCRGKSWVASWCVLCCALYQQSHKLNLQGGMPALTHCLLVCAADQLRRD